MTTVCIVGLGYVGLPLLVKISSKFEVIGFDQNSRRIEELKKGNDSTFEVSKTDLRSTRETVKYTDDISLAKDCSIFIITVPTPIDVNKEPDFLPLQKASKSVGKILKKDDIVIYESTVYPGATEEICVPILERESHLIFNKDFFCGYSPERVNPGDKNHPLESIVKVTSGSTPEVADLVDSFYKQFISAGTYKASSIKVAEAAKVIENTQRDVNIALINEFSIIFSKIGLNTSEVLEAAKTKWNFLDFKPGLVGGHCIGVDPYYLSFKAQTLGYMPNLILGARQINSNMGIYVANQTIKKLVSKNKSLQNCDVLILGATFKENCPDLRNSLIEDIYMELKSFGLNVFLSDPYINSNNQPSYLDKKNIVEYPLLLKKKFQSIIFAVAHEEFINSRQHICDDFLDQNGVIIDIKNIFNGEYWSL